MSQSTLKRYFNPTREEPLEKQRKELSINLLVVSINNILDVKVEKEEITIIASHGCSS